MSNGSMRVLWGGAIFVALLGCSKAKSDGFDAKGVPLRLLPAPGGLCEGNGAQKECSNPAGCVAQGGGTPAGATPPGMPPQAASPASPGNFTSEPDFAGDVGFAEPVSVNQPPSDGTAVTPPPAIATTAPVPTAAPTVTPMPTPSSDAGGSSATGDAGFTLAVGDAGAAPSTEPVGSETSLDAGSPPTTSGDAGSPTDPDPSFAQLKSPLATSCGSIDHGNAATLYLSADDSNSTASAAIARRLITLGQYVPPSIIRPYEFLNYYDFAFEPAAPSEVRIVPQLSSCPVNGELNLQVALQSRHRVDGHLERRSAHRALGPRRHRTRRSDDSPGGRRAQR